MSINQELNYAKADDFSLALEHFGGKEFLKGNFPNMLQMLYNTRELHQKLTDNAQDEPVGYVDTFNIVNLCPHPEQRNAAGISGTAVLSVSNMSLVQKASFLHISSKIWDPVSKKPYASEAWHTEDANTMKTELPVSYSALDYTKNPRLQTVSNFVTVRKVNGKSVCVTNNVERVMEIDLADLKPDIKSIKVDQPVPKNPADTLIRVVYNGRTDPYANYNFKNVRDEMIGIVRYVEVYYPFSISVELDDAFQYCREPVKLEEEFMAYLASDVVQGGSVPFHTSYTKNIRSSVNGNTLKLDFSYQGDTDANFWGTKMPLTARQAEGAFNFYLEFSVFYTFKGDTSTVFSTPIIVTSENYPGSSNKVSVKPARILWGCLGKDTRLLTEEGYRNISDVKPGDRLYTDKGYIRLKNMVTGMEEKIVAVGVSEENTLLLTEKHPIVTDRGIIYAADLTISDKLRMEDGSFREIYYLEIKEYNDQVYCPELEESALIAADGIMVGDYLTTVNVVAEPEEEPEPLEPELMEELIRWSEWQRQRMKEELAKEGAI